MKRSDPLMLVLVCVLGAGGCGGAGTGPTTSTATSTMSATIDGQNWTAVQVQVQHNGGDVEISGNDGRSLGIQLGFLATGIGTLTFGTGVPAGATVSLGNTVWVAGTYTGSGSVSVTSLSASEIKGMFAFTAHSDAVGVQPADRSVINGRFDVIF